MTPAGPARAHSMLLAAAAAAEAGDEDDSDKRLEQTARIAPADVRAAVGRMARALGRHDPASASALRFSDAQGARADHRGAPHVLAVARRRIGECGRGTRVAE